MKNKYKVSVIIPVYQAECYIERCVRSLFEQTMDDIQYVFVDDCTPDKSIEIISRLLLEFTDRNDDVVIVKHHQNMGQAAARNSGLCKACGEYIGWVDADDYVDSSMFMKLYETAQINEADIVCCDIVRERREGMTKEEFSYEKESKDDVMKHIEGGVYSALWNKIIRRSLYEENHIRFANGVNMWDDLSVTLPLRYFSKKTIVIHETLYVYNNMNDSSITMSHRSLIHQMQMVRCLEYLLDRMNNSMPPKHLLTLLEFGFKTKEFLLYPPYFNLMQWRECISESNRYVMSYAYIPFIKKIKFYFCLKFPYFLINNFLKKHYKL
jgi:glycosyltransferase involved in cell wall biosynthesis